MNKKKINQLLEEANIDFEQTDKTLYIPFLYGFTHHDQYYGGVSIMKGLNEYKYYTFYEVMMWYRYYTCKRHNITHIAPDGLCSNSSYFSRIPSYYRTTSPEKGLSIIKEAITQFLDHYNGFPKYYSEDRLDEICYIK